LNAILEDPRRFTTLTAFDMIQHVVFINRKNDRGRLLETREAG